MEYRIPPTNWTSHLADAIDECENGDVIIVSSESMKELGERANNRMCPDKNIIFRVDSVNKYSCLYSEIDEQCAQRAAIIMFLQSLEDIELATLCNVATAKFKPMPNHHGYDKWHILYGCANETLDDDVVDIILSEVSKRL